MVFHAFTLSAKTFTGKSQHPKKRSDIGTQSRLKGRFRGAKVRTAGRIKGCIKGKKRAFVLLSASRIY